MRDDTYAVDVAQNYSNSAYFYIVNEDSAGIIPLRASLKNTKYRCKWQDLN